MDMVRAAPAVELVENVGTFTIIWIHAGEIEKNIIYQLKC